jgi:hypothetical protein
LAFGSTPPRAIATGSGQERREQKWEAQEMKERPNKVASRAKVEVVAERATGGWGGGGGGKWQRA